MWVQAIPHRSETIRAHKTRGGRVAAVLPVHYPRALFRAVDVVPVEVWGPPQVDTTLGAAHLQPYVCSIVRNALAFLMSGGLAETDFIVVPHACDSLQGFASILIDFVQPHQTVLPIYLPRDTRASDVQFLAEELRALYRRLAEITQRTPTDAELMECIACEEEADSLLADLHTRRKHLPHTQLELYRLIRAREFLPTDLFSAHARDALARFSDVPRHEGIPIILSGIVPEPMSIFDSIEKMGGYVIADDFAACGRRLYPRGASDDPFVRMAERIVNAPPDSTRGSSIQARLDHLLRLVETKGARGVVFYDVKFCEPELFYLPTLRQGLQDAGVPSAAVEIDLNDQLPHQVLTRIEAFLEMIADSE
ncbi:(R)-2-hydroxyisocaproyl-CoA dehydratase beta subunit [Anaerolineae bacterium]|nr:(R)-2-hydroxyisocaproyl-CoA dehydratase beta subunit [Anaerolineae bacterium]